jgi:acyl-CoA thioesterase I
MLSRSKTAIAFCAMFVSISVIAARLGRAQNAAQPGWTCSEERLRPFCLGEIMEGESVLFIMSEKNGEARESVLFPIQKLLAVASSTGELRYEEGQDYSCKNAHVP